MQSDKASTFLNKERARILTALRQLDNSDEQLQAQAANNAASRAELRLRLAEIDEALMEAKASTEETPDESAVPAA